MLPQPATPPPAPVKTLLQRLRLEHAAPNGYASSVPSEYSNRVYGGHTLAQASLAAVHGAGAKNLVSFKAYFLAPGSIELPIRFDVQTLRDGKSFTIKSVQAFQEERQLLSWQGMLGVAQDPEEARQETCPDVPDPEDLLPLWQVREQNPNSPDGFKWPPGKNWWEHSRPFDVRYIGGTRQEPGARCYWLRAQPAPGASQNEQRAIFSFASDHSFATSVSHARGDLAAGIQRGVASLDHDLWFHRDVEAGQWYLFVQRSPFSTDRLGLATGQFFNMERQLVATVSQQVLRSSS